MRSRVVTIAVVLSLAVFAVAFAQPATTERTPDVPYVPTPERIVDEMLKLANVGRKDVLYDLGSGDGRIVITAAKRFGTRGVGIEIDPVRIREARDNAKAAGVENLVKFVEGDIFEAPIRAATVVTMYLLPDVNMKLRPRLLSELRPGTRIVSHNYDLGDWKPRRQVRLSVDGTSHEVFFWVVPPRAAARP